MTRVFSSWIWRARYCSLTVKQRELHRLAQRLPVCSVAVGLEERTAGHARPDAGASEVRMIGGVLDCFHSPEAKNKKARREKRETAQSMRSTELRDFLPTEESSFGAFSRRENEMDEPNFHVAFSLSIPATRSLVDVARKTATMSAASLTMNPVIHVRAGFVPCFSSRNAHVAEEDTESIRPIT